MLNDLPMGAPKLKIWEQLRFCFFTVLFCFPTLGPAYSVKNSYQAARGCQSRIDLSQAQNELRRFKLTTQGATAAEVISLGTGLSWIENLNGGAPLRFAQGPGRAYPFIFRNQNGNSKQTAGGIIISRNGAKSNGTNVAQLIHELGHLVGNQGVYEMYRQAVGNMKCLVSSYSNSSFNEQFAEVFAAFVTNPEKIRNNPSKACQRVWQFFTQKLFKDGDSIANTCLIRQASNSQGSSYKLSRAQPSRNNLQQVAFTNSRKSPYRFYHSIALSSRSRYQWSYHPYYRWQPKRNRISSY